MWVIPIPKNLHLAVKQTLLFNFFGLNVSDRKFGNCIELLLLINVTISEKLYYPKIVNQILIRNYNSMIIILNNNNNNN